MRCELDHRSPYEICRGPVKRRLTFSQALCEFHYERRCIEIGQKKHVKDVFRPRYLFVKADLNDDFGYICEFDSDENSYAFVAFIQAPKAEEFLNKLNKE